jgi:hypothetical protein
MRVNWFSRGSARGMLLALGIVLWCICTIPAQQMVTETRDLKQTQDEQFAKLYKEWTGEPRYGSPLVDHLPVAAGIPTPKDVLGYYIGAPKKLTYYADILKFYRALEAATPRVKVETIGKSDEGRDLVVVWVSSEENLKGLQANRDNLAKIADPRGLSEEQIRRLIATTRPDYHLIGGLHSSETGPSEMLMELVYRLAVETSPLINQIRDNVYVSVTPVADPDGRDRVVDWFYREQENTPAAAPTAPASGEAQAPGGRGAGPASVSVPYWGKYVYHDNNRDINLSLAIARSLAEWYYSAHPLIMHDLHESLPLMFTYSGGPPQNPNLDPLLFAELPWFSTWELAQMTKWGMPGVYTHAFMDGWSPGYLGSVSYNHNSLMRMYETQSGRDPGSQVTAGGTTTEPQQGRGTEAPAAVAGEGRGSGAGGRGPAANEAPQARGGVPGARPPSETTAASATQAAPAGRGGEPPAGRGTEPPAGARAGAVPSGRGGTQEREWYRGLPVPQNAANTFSRRDNANYQETGILSSLQLTAIFPNTLVENFYVRTKNAIEEGKTKAPYGYVIPAQKDMTRVARLIEILRIQAIEIGQTASEVKLGDVTVPAGSYVIKRDQPYGRLAKNLLERQVYPDPRLSTYDDSGWTMGLQMLVEVKEISDPAILKIPVTPVSQAKVLGRVAGSGNAALAVAHLGSNNMIAFRYQCKDVPMKIAEKSFAAEGIEFPAGSFVIPGAATADIRAAVEKLGLTAAALSALPAVPMHDSSVPRVAVYSQWTSTQDIGWYRLTFDKFGIPYDLIYKEQVKQGGLREKYDVILMAAQNINRQVVLQKPAPRPQPYAKSEKYQFLGMYGETPDMSGGFGQEGVDAIARFLEGGGTLIAAGAAIRFPIEFGFARTVDSEPATGITAQRPIVQAEITRMDHPVFYGYGEKILPLKYSGNSVLRVGVADQENVIARYVGGDASVLSGLMVGADQLKQRPIAADVPNAWNGKGRVILFANNPVYRWQNHGEFNMMFNSLLNWNYVPPRPPQP